MNTFSQPFILRVEEYMITASLGLSQYPIDGVEETVEILIIEVLLRWKRSEYGFVSPFKFIPLAEKIQLILPIGC